MDIEPLSIEGAIKFTPKLFGDERGVFSELFKAPLVKPKPSGTASTRAGTVRVPPRVIRGIHFADVPKPGQVRDLA